MFLTQLQMIRYLVMLLSVCGHRYLIVRILILLTDVFMKKNVHVMIDFLYSNKKHIFVLGYIIFEVNSDY